MGFYGYHSYDVVGYVENEYDVVCDTCVADSIKAYPIFAGSEWDYQPTCDFCHCEIDGVTVLDQD